MARKAGVSRSAVSRAFTPGASISPATKRKVIEASRDLGYRVNQLARGLSNRRSDLVGLVVADMDNPFRSEQVQALAKALVNAGYRPLLFPADSSSDSAHIIRELLQYNLSGLVVTSNAPSSEICSECSRIGVPLVLVNRSDQFTNADIVIGDNEAGGKLAAKTLIACGCNDLVLLRPQKSSYSFEVRANSFTRFAKQEGIKVEIFPGDEQTYLGGLATAKTFMKRPINNTGVFCPADYMALGFLDEIKLTNGIQIPDDLCLIGYDDILQSGWHNYKLTTIRQPVDKLAQKIVSVLTNRINDPKRKPELKVVAVELIQRGTTRKVSNPI